MPLWLIANGGRGVCVKYILSRIFRGSGGAKGGAGEGAARAAPLQGRQFRSQIRPYIFGSATVFRTLFLCSFKVTNLDIVSRKTF